MKTSAKIMLGGAAAVLVSSFGLAGAGWADRGFPHGGMHRGGMHMGMIGCMGHEMLRSVDTNADGALSQEEIDAALNARFTEFDANADGKLTLDEFQPLWAEVTRPIAVRAFQFLDPDGDAALAKTELDERFGALVERFDRNDDGKLSPDDHHGRGRWAARGDDDDNDDDQGGSEE